MIFTTSARWNRIESDVFREGELYMHGGRSEKDIDTRDVWTINTNGRPTSWPLKTKLPKPGVRTGQAALLVGNIFIMFGGELISTDLLDDALYILDTSETTPTLCLSVTDLTRHKKMVDDSSQQKTTWEGWSYNESPA